MAHGEFLSETQLKKLLRYVTEKANLARQNGTKRPIVDELIILLLVETGLSASELCNLNIADRGDFPIPDDPNMQTWIGLRSDLSVI